MNKKIEVKRLLRAVGVVAVTLLFARLMTLVPTWLSVAFLSLLWVIILYRTSNK